MTQEKPKSWLSREVSVQWVAGLVVTGVVWIWQKDRADAIRIAGLETQMAQRPDLVDRRNREQDALKQCLERQIDILMRCK